MPKTAATTTNGPARGSPLRPIQKPARATRRDADLDDLPADQGVAFAVTIRQPAGDGAEDRPGSVIDDHHQRDGFGFAERVGLDAEEHGRGADGLIVEGGEELGRQQADERARPKFVGGLKRGHDHPGEKHRRIAKPQSGRLAKRYYMILRARGEGGDGAGQPFRFGYRGQVSPPLPSATPKSRGAPLDKPPGRAYSPVEREDRKPARPAPSMRLSV